MTLFQKRVSLAVACLFALVYSCPLLGLSGTVTTENVFLNYTINTTTCKLSTVDSIPVTIYFGIFALIVLCNLVFTIVLCIPVFIKIKDVFLDKSKNKSLATKKKQYMSSQEVLDTSLKNTYASAIVLKSNIKTTAKKGILISNKSMVSVNDYNEFPQDRYSDILLCHTVLVVIGTVIGVLGNSVTIVFYSCRIKERGERYFIPLLAIVDLIACLTISTKYGISGTKTSEDVFRNHTINTTSCSLSTAGTKSTTIYFGLLALIILCNLVITTVLCIPVLKRIQTSFPNNSGTKSLDNKQEQNISSQVLEISSKKTSGIEVLSVIKTTANSKLSGNSDTLNIVSNQELAYGSNRNKGPLTYALQNLLQRIIQVLNKKKMKKA
ncbi:unnamed protein product [Mytilus edulis]|uniref:G-protein coupled receptors family 1 profile domain-containing protein n=1 Tax=Mytilus edulis TaxID=6550 RepID=A0A8S3SII3_MYTED|nr:unnamed protein product [Mytilus edulis]